MASDRTVRVVFAGDPARLKAALSQVGQGFDGLGQKAGQATEKVGSKFKGLSDRFAGLGKTIGGLAAGGAIVAFAKSSITAASDLNESMSKVKVVFGQASGAVVDFSKKAAQNLGMAQQQALEATGTFGNLFRALGVGVQPASEMSTKIVQLAADLASFNNANPEDVLLALRSGLVGEAEPLRKFGVSLSAARIEQEAMNLGLADSKGELTAAAKAQAAYSIIMKDTTLAQGDFARTSGGLANQQRILAARFKDMQAQIGTAFLPLITSVVTAFSNLLPVLAGVGQASAGVIGFFQNNAAAAAALGTVLAGTLVPRLLEFLATQAAVIGAGLVEFLETAYLQLLIMADGFKATAAAEGIMVATTEALLGPIGLLLAAGTAMFLMFRKGKQDLTSAQKAADELGKTLGQKFQSDVSGSADEVSKLNQRNFELTKRLSVLQGVMLNGSRLNKDQAAEYRAINAEIGSNVGKIKELEDAQKQQQAAADAASKTTGQVWADALGVSTDRVEELAAALKIDLAKATDEDFGKVEQLKNGINAADGAAADYSDQLKVLASHTSTAAEKTDAFKKAMEDLTSPVEDAKRAEIDWQAAIDKVADSIKENGRTLDDNTEKGRNNLGAVLDQIDAARDLLAAYAAQPGGIAKAQAAYPALREQLVQTAIKFGMSKQAAQQYVDQLLQIPPNVATAVYTPGLDAALRNVQLLQDRLDRLGRNATVSRVGPKGIAPGDIPGGPTKITYEGSGAANQVYQPASAPAGTMVFHLYNTDVKQVGDHILRTLDRDLAAQGVR